MAFRANEPAEMTSLFDGMLASLPKNKTLMTIKAVVNWGAVRRGVRDA